MKQKHIFDLYGVGLFFPLEISKKFFSGNTGKISALFP